MRDSFYIKLCLIILYKYESVFFVKKLQKIRFVRKAGECNMQGK